MTKTLLAATLFALATPTHAMTATVSSSSPPASEASAAPKSSGANGSQAPRAGAVAPAQAMPNASALTQPANVLLAPDVPPKASSNKRGASGKDKSLIVPPAQSSATRASPVDAQWKRTANAETRMQRGAIQAISMEKSTFEVHGEKLNFDAREVKVFARDGKPTNIYAVKSGVPVRFAIDAKDKAKRRVTVIWVDN